MANLEFFITKLYEYWKKNCLLTNNCQLSVFPISIKQIISEERTKITNQLIALQMERKMYMLSI